MFRVSKPTGTYLRAVLKMGGPAQNDAWHEVARDRNACAASETVRTHQNGAKHQRL